MFIFPPNPSWTSCEFNTHIRRDSTRQLSRVGVGGVYWALVNGGCGGGGKYCGVGECRWAPSSGNITRWADVVGDVPPGSTQLIDYVQSCSCCCYCASWRGVPVGCLATGSAVITHRVTDNDVMLSTSATHTYSQFTRSTIAVYTVSDILFLCKIAQWGPEERINSGNCTCL